MKENFSIRHIWINPAKKLVEVCFGWLGSFVGGLGHSKGWKGEEVLGIIGRFQGKITSQ